MLGTVAAVLSSLQDVVIISLATEMSPVQTNGWCEGMLCNFVPLTLILMWAGRQQGSKMVCHHAIKRQRPRLGSLTSAAKLEA